MTDPAPHPLLSAFAAWCTGGTPIEDPGAFFAEDETGLDWWIETWQARTAFVETFGFLVPTAALVCWLAQLPSILEIGAGRGLLSHLVRQAGGDMLATDPAPWGPMPDGLSPAVVQASALEALARFDRPVVLSAWPSLNDPWLAEAVQAMAPGQQLVYIGENAGGCTADDSFFDLIEGGALHPLPVPGNLTWSFPGIHDDLYHFVRT